VNNADSITSPEPLKRKCEIAQVLPASVIQLVVAAPHNETVRSVLLAHLKQSVPEELKTFNDIKDWIEFNIEVPKAPTPPKNEAIQVLISASELERGTCRYERTLKGEGMQGIRRLLILEIAEESDGAEDFFERTREAFRDYGLEISMDEDGDGTDYSSYEHDGGDGADIEIKPEGVQALKDALAAIDPEEYERIFGEPPF
jgi:hypothetical protein